MNLNILLWICGMFFSLGIFAVKVGLGLGYGRIKKRWVCIALGGYVALFVGIALLSKTLIGIVDPLLRKGPYLHILIAAGMIAWGFHTIRRVGRTNGNDTQAECCGAPAVYSLPLILPCPVCICAITVSMWSALTVVRLHAALIGLGVGISFAAMTLAVMTIARFRRYEHPGIALGLTMITVGLYFVGSLFLPAKIEEAKGMYASLSTENNEVSSYHGMAIWAILLVVMLIGFFAGKRREVKQ